MKRTLSLLPLLALLLLVASCSKTPGHAAFIPKDAQVVFSVNTGALQKKLTWSFITGSDMLKQLRESGAGGSEGVEAIRDLQNAGLDFSSSLYFYTKADTRFEGNTRVNAIIPVSDASKIPAYIQKHIPQARISQHNGRSVAMTDNGSMSWNDKMLIISNIAVRKETVQQAPTMDSIGGLAVPMEGYSYTRNIPDTMLTLAQLDSAFTKPSKNLLDDARFKQLQADGHDVSFWLSYDNPMNSLRGQQGMEALSVMSGSYWQNSAMAAGLDFKDGEIVSDGKYFVSDSLRGIAKEFAKNNVDANMLQRLPASGLNFALGYHLNTDAVRMVLDKLGMSAMANTVLSQQGLNLDDILGAFTGDIVMAVNNFRVESKMQQLDSSMMAMGMTPYETKKPEMDVVFAMKVKDQSKVQKLLGFVSNSGMLAAAGPNTWTLANSADGSMLTQQGEYLVAGSSQPVVTNFVGGGSPMPPAVKAEISGHPYGMWADVNSFVTGVGSMQDASPSDAAAFNAVRGVFTDFTFHGGEFQGEASVFSMKLGFANKKENSLLQIVQMIQKVATRNGGRPVVMR